MTKEEIIKLYMAYLNNLVAASDANRNRIIYLEDELEELKQEQTLPIDSVVGRSEQLKAFAQWIINEEKINSKRPETYIKDFLESL